MLMALPQQGTETIIMPLYKYNKKNIVLMALPQQGTETLFRVIFYFKTQNSVNGLTPTGDGNSSLKFLDAWDLVLMALPQQGTETKNFSYESIVKLKMC